MNFQKIISPLVSLAVLLSIAETLVQTGIVKSYILPAPSQVFALIVEQGMELLFASFSTMLNAVIALFLSFVIGFLIAITLNQSKLLRDALYPFAVFFQTVPMIALAPVLVIWFGFGAPTVIASAFICALFPIIASILLGLESTESQLIEMFKLYGASRLDILLKLKIPSSLPQMFSGLRIGSGLAVIGAIVGEFIAGGGLGAVIDSARTQTRMDKVFAAVLFSSVLGLIFFASINILSHHFLKHWHASERQN